MDARPINSGGFKQYAGRFGVHGYFYRGPIRTSVPGMSELIQRLKSVHSKVCVLVEERSALQRQLDGLEAAAQEKHQEIEVLKARLAGLEQENEVLRIARSLNGGEGKAEAKQRIDQLVDEIDRCLALINA